PADQGGREDHHRSDRQVDLTEQEHEHDPDRERPRDPDLEDEVGEIAGAQEDAFLVLEVAPDRGERHEHRERAELARAETQPGDLDGRFQGAGEAGLLRLLDRLFDRGRFWGGGRHQAAACSRAPVMAATTSSGVALSWSNVAARRPSRSTTIRSATSKT